MRSRSLASSPVAVATAIRTNAKVCGSRLIIFSPRQPATNTHLSHELSSRIRDGLVEKRRRLRFQSELLKYCRDRERRCEAVTVLDLQGQTEAFAHEQRAVDAFRADLCNHAPRVRAHHLCARPPFAC